MKNQSEDKELLSVVNFILNKADEAKLEVISAALDRRKQGSTGLSGGLSNINPEMMAKKMSTSINTSIQSSLDGMTRTVRNFASDIIRQEAPELSQKQLDALLDSWMPSQGNGTARKSLAKNGKVSGVPADILYGMIIQFVSYSIGEMSDSENNDLKRTMGDWTKKYWDHFPTQVRQEIKTFLNGEKTSGEFKKNIRALIS